MDILKSTMKWIKKDFFAVENLVQFAVVLLVFVATYFLAAMIIKWLNKKKITPKTPKATIYKYFLTLFDNILFPLMSLIILWVYMIVSQSLTMDIQIIDAFVSLLTAWIVIRSVSSFVKNKSFSKILSVLIWFITALSIFGWLSPILVALDKFVIHIGDAEISILTGIKGIVILAVILWVTSALSNVSRKYIYSIAELTPSTQVLLSKLVRILLLSLAIIISLNSIGINLTTFAVFSGAVGIGIGFGLQKVISNFISGIILLMDKSIKPGDVIAIGDTYGWVNALGARYVSVITRDGKEHLIPNESLITEKVENWSFSNSEVRIRIPIGISYDSDVKKAMALAIEAASEVTRVLERPIPVCLLSGFGESSVDLELRVWISDPSNGMKNVQSLILLKVWEKYHEHKITFPFPQRDVYIRNYDKKCIET